MAGSGSNGATEPSERTTLLSKDAIKPIDSSLSDSINPEGNANGNGYGGTGDAPKSGVADSIMDEENGEVGEAVNPLFEGNDFMAKKMHLLFPAVAIGVSISFIWLGTVERQGSDCSDCEGRVR
jgi:hypothetical protein